MLIVWLIDDGQDSSIANGLLSQQVEGYRLLSLTMPLTVSTAISYEDLLE